jgi:hypothetical protein
VPNLNPLICFESAFQLVDDALMSAAKAGKKTTEEADTAFEYAVSRLGYYEGKYHSKKTVVKRIKAAEKEDKSSLKVLNGLMERICVREELIIFTSLHHTLILIFSL